MAIRYISTQDLLASRQATATGEDPNEPNYAWPWHRRQQPWWTVCQDSKEGTDTYRAKKETYLPRFESESEKDWQARVMMTFADSHYQDTLDEHTGIVFAQPPKWGDDIPAAMKPDLENIDGEGNHANTFAQLAFQHSLDYGFSLIFTDYPAPKKFRNQAEVLRAKQRPYATVFKANDVMSARLTVYGGTTMITQIVLRERRMEAVGRYGTEECVRYRVLWQDVVYDVFSGAAKELGQIHWQVKKPVHDEANKEKPKFITEDEGVVIGGPPHIPVRVIYGGERLGFLYARPHLLSLARTMVEETQVKSDYAAVMHKCNVPTPIFIGRSKVNNEGVQAKVVMGEGLDLNPGGDAKMLEPAGTALAATRQRLEDIRAVLRRQGASASEAASGPSRTALEWSYYMQQRNAKLVRAATSLQDGLEGMLEDFASYRGIPPTGNPEKKSGGSVHVLTTFATSVIMEPQYLNVLFQVWTATRLDIEPVIDDDAFRHALQTGRLPDDMDQVDRAIRLLSEERAKQDAGASEPKPKTEPFGGPPKEPEEVDPTEEGE